MAKSPAAILYDENGVRVGVEDNALRISADPAKVAVHANATVTSDSSVVLTGYGQTELLLFLNIKASPTGTDPTLQYTVEEVDPGDETTVIGTAVSSEVFTAIGNQTISFVTLNGGAVKVSWAVTGTDTPSFAQVYATVLAKSGGATQMLGVGVGASYPDPLGAYKEPVAGEKVAVSIDDYGNMMTRGPILTDEDSFFDDFITPALSDDWTVTAIGQGSHSVYQSLLILTAGLTAGSAAIAAHAADYAPMTASFIARVDNRQRGQETYLGFSNDPTNPPKKAYVAFTGDNPRVVQLVTWAADTQIETTDVELPNSWTSSEFHRYTIEIGAGYVVLRVDDLIVGTHKRHIPGPYDVMDVGCTLVNTLAVNLATSVVVDSVSFRNHNAVEIAGHFTGDPIRTQLEGDTSVGIRGQHADVVVEHEGLHKHGAEVSYGRELLAVADPEMRSTLNDILVELRKGNLMLAELSGLRIDNEDVE